MPPRKSPILAYNACHTAAGAVAAYLQQLVANLQLLTAIRVETVRQVVWGSSIHGQPDCCDLAQSYIQSVHAQLSIPLINPQEEHDMTSIFTWVTAIALGTAGPALAGMQGQGAGPEGKEIPEYKERKPGGYRYEFNNMDQDADRHISREEARVNRHLFEQFDRLDANNDNQLDKSELAAFETGPRASAAASVGATVNDIVENSEAFAGVRVTVLGTVERVHGPHALVIRGDGGVLGFFANELPVLSTQPFPRQDRGLLEDAAIKATGTVREFSAADIERELGWDLDPELEVEFEDKRAVLVADSVEITRR